MNKLFLALLVAAISCSREEPTTTNGNPREARQLPEAIRPDATRVVSGNNTFAFDMYLQLRDQKGNLFFSPFSISTAFAMVQAGALGQTQAEIARVFHFPTEPDRLHPVYRELLKSLDTGVQFEGYRLNIANRLWGEKDYHFLGDYLAVTREQYGAELETADFEADPEGMRNHINLWVEEKTEKKITDLFPAGSITVDTRLVLANAIYFKGTWDQQFDPRFTSDQPFHVSSTEEASVPMMHRNDTFAMGRGDNLAILELPYAGEDLSMLVLLPDEVDGLAQLEETMTAEKLESLRASLRSHDVDVTLPKFTMTSSFSLNQMLAAMGMPTVFTDQADLSGMNGTGGLFIQAAVHKAFVNVNEEGTEAAAATGISVGVTSMPPSFHADHPFLFLIRDNVTGSILFMGRVVDPTS